MKRYQITLDQQSIAALDELGKVLKMSKAKIIKQALKQLKETFATILPKTHIKINKKSSLDNLIGIIDLKTDHETNYALKDDDTYLKD